MMSTMRPAYRAIAVGAAAIWAWDVFCPKGETITAGFAGLRDSWGTAAVGATVFMTAAHLMGWLPQQLDPYELIALSRVAVS